MLKVGIAQIAPVFLNRQATVEKVVDWIGRAQQAGCRLVCFGESLIPAYPLWLSRTDGAKFESPDQKLLHAKYLEQAVDPNVGDLEPICRAAKHARLTVVVGIAERAADRGGHTLFCSRVVIDPTGTIASIHRKLMPTYEERLAWGMGDGAGLVTHRVGEFTLGSLNCWENWMPLARAALYASGEDLHVALWPGDSRLTCDITRFIAQEGRSFVISACALIHERDIPTDVPLRDRMVQPGEIIYNGGSCIADPKGQWLVEPLTDREELLIADLDIDQVRQERQNFDPPGHYSRPDVLRLTVDRRRQTAAEFIDR